MSAVLKLSDRLFKIPGLKWLNAASLSVNGFVRLGTLEKYPCIYKISFQKGTKVHNRTVCVTFRHASLHFLSSSLFLCKASHFWIGALCQNGPGESWANNCKCSSSRWPHGSPCTNAAAAAAEQSRCTPLVVLDERRELSIRWQPSVVGVPALCPRTGSCLLSSVNIRGQVQVKASVLPQWLSSSFHQSWILVWKLDPYLSKTYFIFFFYIYHLFFSARALLEIIWRNFTLHLFNWRNNHPFAKYVRL